MGERFFIFGRSSCPFCVMAVDLCKASSREHIFMDYSDNTDILEDYKQFYSQTTVPIILRNCLTSGETFKVGGYTDLLEHLK